MVYAIGASIASVMSVVLGGAVLGPVRGRSEEDWYDAGTLSGLAEGEPAEVAIRVDRNDGYYATTERRLAYLVRVGPSVRAISTTCTHLGCRVSWSEADRLFKCPCHGGRYTIDGAVADGPPPRSLDELPVEVRGDRIRVRLG